MIFKILGTQFDYLPPQLVMFLHFRVPAFFLSYNDIYLSRKLVIARRPENSFPFLFLATS